jgi:DNA polymerase-1
VKKGKRAASEPEERLPEFPTPLYRVISTPAELAAALPQLLAQPLIGIDCESTGLDPLSNLLRSVQLATPSGVVIVDAFTCPLDLLTPLFTTERVLLFHNAKFDLQLLIVAGMPWPKAKIFDTLLATQLLDAGIKRGHKLQDLVARYLQQALPKELQTSAWGGELSPEQYAYAARDSAVLLPLYALLRKEIDAAGLNEVYDIECRCAPALAAMELAGCQVDVQAWRERADRVSWWMAQLERKLNRLRLTVAPDGSPLPNPPPPPPPPQPITLISLPSDPAQRRKVPRTKNPKKVPPFNWNSNAQLLALLRARGHVLEDTQAGTLARLTEADVLIKPLLWYKKAAKQTQTYGRSWLAEGVSVVTGRVHADFLQLGAASGRMSCIHPPLQTIPRGRIYRSLIKAPEGMCLIKADFSQLQLRIAADISQDEAMLAAFARGEDIHSKTAAEVLGITGKKVGAEERQMAKAINFGLIFGMSAAGLRHYARDSYGVSMTASQAKNFHRKFFQVYHELALWHARLKGQMLRERSSTTRTPLGRLRHNVTSDRVLANSPVQGGEADGLKLSLALLHENRHEAPDAVLICCVHDEILVECPPASAERTARWLQKYMVEAMGRVVGYRVPILVDAGCGLDWGNIRNFTLREEGGGGDGEDRTADNTACAV